MFLKSRRYLHYAFSYARRYGALETIRVALRAVRDYGLPQPRSAFDLARKVDTDGKCSIRALTVVGENAAAANPYQASSERLFRDHIAELDVPLEQFTFLDLGCGKGRTLILACDFPFRRIIGVEFVKELAEVAIRNLQTLGLSNRVEVVLGDAVEYDFPDGPLLTYLYNPFGADLVARVTSRLANRMQLNILLYENPQCRDALDPRFEITKNDSSYLIAHSRRPAETQ
jgi:SAM-dependent methyltransferase